MFTENIRSGIFLSGLNVERFTGDYKELLPDMAKGSKKMFYDAEQFITLFEKSENRIRSGGDKKNPSWDCTQDGFLIVITGNSGSAFNYNAISFSITCFPL
ncbi:hypothetical protein SLH46_02545 [Draconibacterium sp. IB214405]|uniref:hypothetical protein n=1 Tax=Draconibacterium sp. IB214405 TaxID=3097352 RepID=UPI002A0BF657|nr:hypothetical protein [Draconibacterium sp. IB214405]MDX8338044.1 hypothetical protein [Draconibacterium sp. IB214405]